MLYQLAFVLVSMTMQCLFTPQLVDGHGPFVIFFKDWTEVLVFFGILVSLKVVAITLWCPVLCSLIGHLYHLYHSWPMLKVLNGLWRDTSQCSHLMLAFW